MAARLTRGRDPDTRRAWWGRWLLFTLITASHPLLDSLTSGGLGVAFFAPFDNSRYFLSWRPLVVSPIGITRFFGSWGLRVLGTEVPWVWVPTAALVTAVSLARRRSGRAPPDDPGVRTSRT